MTAPEVPLPVVKSDTQEKKIESRHDFVPVGRKLVFDTAQVGDSNRCHSWNEQDVLHIQHRDYGGQSARYAEHARAGDQRCHHSVAARISEDS